MEKTIAFFWEYYEFGGVSTNLASLINSKKFRKKKIIIFSNKSNKALIRFKKSLSSNLPGFNGFHSFIGTSSICSKLGYNPYLIFYYTVFVILLGNDL